MMSTLGRSMCVIVGLSVVLVAMPVASLAADRPAGFVAAVRPEAHLERSGQHLDVGVGMSVFAGDRLVTGDKGRIKILLSDDAVVALGANSQVELSAHLFDPAQGVRKTRLQLLGGAIRALVQKVVAGEETSFEVRSGTAVAGVRGTEFVVEQSGEGSRLVTLSGAVAWSTAGAEPIMVAAGQASRMTSGQVSNPEALAAVELKQVRRLTDTIQAPTALAWNMAPDRMKSGRIVGGQAVSPSDGLQHDPSSHAADGPARSVEGPDLIGGPPGGLASKVSDDYSGNLVEIDDGYPLALEGNWKNSAIWDPVQDLSGARLVIRLHRKVRP